MSNQGWQKSKLLAHHSQEQKQLKLLPTSLQERRVYNTLPHWSKSKWNLFPTLPTAYSRFWRLRSTLWFLTQTDNYQGKGLRTTQCSSSGICNYTGKFAYAFLFLLGRVIWRQRKCHLHSGHYISWLRIYTTPCLILRIQWIVHINTG